MMQFHITLIMMSKFIMKIVCYFKKHFVTRIRNFVFTYRKSIERKCPVTNSTYSTYSTSRVILKNVTQTIFIKFIFFILTSNCFLGDFVAVVYDKCLNVYLFLFLQ